MLDGGDPEETLRVKELLGFLDGQTTNPSLISKNPRLKEALASGRRLSGPEEMAEYRRIVQVISPLVGEAGVSIEVLADERATAQAMLNQGQEMYTWITNAFIKYPCTAEGLRAAELSVSRGMRVNMTLCFSQQQAAAVYAATKSARAPIYVSPFIGRLDDTGRNGMDLVRNIMRMYSAGDGHVAVLAASIRSVEQMLYCFLLETELVTAPAKVLKNWADNGFRIPGPDFEYESSGQPIQYEQLDLSEPWDKFDIQHELTKKGIEKFAADYRAMLSPG